MQAEAKERLDLLDQYVRDLRDAQAPTLEALQANKMLRRYTERMLHMAIDTCIQIAIGILTREGYRSPENYRDLFTVLGEHEILSPEAVKGMTGLVEFRNLLVYEHEAVDAALVYGFVKRRLADLTAFGKAIRAYLGLPAEAAALPFEPPPESVGV
jgi:uncharacterized protein YutE (UPF0331/DUF86 family)